jgi:hypothetical protein
MLGNLLMDSRSLVMKDTMEKSMRVFNYNCEVHRTEQLD